MEKLVGAAVEVVGRNNFIADPGDVEQGESSRSLSGGNRQRAGTAFERRDTLLEDIGCGVHDPGVDVSEFFQGKKIGGMVSALEDVGCGLVNGHGSGASGGINGLAGVQGQGA